MKKTLLIIILLALLSPKGFGQATQTACHWYFPSMSPAQADALRGYDILIVHNELIYKQDPILDYLLKSNPKVKLFAYINPVELFVPQFGDSPWSKKIAGILKKNDRWWLNQANGEPACFWISPEGFKTQMMDMSTLCPAINGEIWADFIARLSLEDILSDKRISGMLIDNAWSTIYWLGRNGRNQGLDFNRDGISDTDSVKIDLAWRSGEVRYIKKIRETKGPDFIIITNPGDRAYTFYADGKQLEDFPFQYLGDTLNNSWNQNMINATKTGKYTVINSRADNWFFALCSSLLLDQVVFSVAQNTPFRKEYNLSLGKPLERALTARDIDENRPVYSRRFENGTVYVEPRTGKSWIIE